MILLISCNKSYENIYYKNSESLNRFVHDESMSFNYLTSIYKCYKDSSKTYVILRPEKYQCIAPMDEDLKILLHVYFSNKYFYEIYLTQDGTKFYIKNEKRIFEDQLKYLFFANTDTAVNKYKLDNDYSIEELDKNWYYIVFTSPD